MRPTGQFDVEGGAAADRILEANRSAEPRDDLLDDAETEPGAALLSCIAGVGLGEFFEHTRSKFSRDAVAVVADRDAYAVAMLAYRDQDLAVLRRELDCVRQEVGDDLGEAVGIGVHLAGGIVVEANADVEAVGKTAARLDDLLDQRARAEALKLKRGLAGLDLLDVEDVVDEADEPLAVDLGNADQSSGRFRESAAGTADQQTERAGDRGQRRPQFVTYGRYELILQPLDPLALADVEDDAEHEQALARVDWIKADLQRDLAAVAPSSV